MGGVGAAAQESRGEDAVGRHGVLVSVDALAVDTRVAEALKTVVKAKLGVDSHVDVLATHTHSAPGVATLLRCGRINERWVAALTSAVERCVSALVLLPLSWVGRVARRVPGVSCNRRRVLVDGTVWKGVVLPPGAVLAHEEPAATMC